MPERVPYTHARATHRMAPEIGALPPVSPLAAPDERGRSGIPATCRRIKPGDNLLAVFRMLPVRSPPFQDALDGLGHSAPGRVQRGVQWENPLAHYSGHRITGLVPLKVLQHEEQAQGWECRGQRDLYCQPRLPGGPGDLDQALILHEWGEQGVV